MRQQLLERSGTRKDPQAGFAASNELMLIALVLVVGVISAWSKFRDQSSAEIKDSIAAIDSYLAGVSPVAQPYAQQWINAAGAVGCNPATAGVQPVPPASCATAVTEVLDPDGTYGVQFAPYTATDLQYSTAAVGSTQSVPAEQHTTLF